MSKSKGWRSGESTRLSPMWPGFESWRRRHMWVEFVVGSLHSSERFFSGYSGFPLFLKTNIYEFQFDRERTDTFQWVLMNSLVLRGKTNYKHYNLLPAPSRRLAPVLKCRRFLSFFQRYIFRDISLTEIYRWLIEILSAILKSTRRGGQSRERL